MVPDVYRAADVVRYDLTVAIPVEIPDDRARPAEGAGRLRPSGQYAAVMCEDVDLPCLPGRSHDLGSDDSVEVPECNGSGIVVAFRVEDTPCQGLAVAVAQLEAAAVPGEDVPCPENDVRMSIAVYVRYPWTARRSLVDAIRPAGQLGRIGRLRGLVAEAAYVST